MQHHVYPCAAHWTHIVLSPLHRDRELSECSESPSSPMCPIAHAHHFHKFLKTSLLFINNAFDNIRHSVDKRKNSNQRQGARDASGERVTPMCWYWKFIHKASRNNNFFTHIEIDESTIDHVLERHKTVEIILHIRRASSSNTRAVLDGCCRRNFEIVHTHGIARMIRHVLKGSFQIVENNSCYNLKRRRERKTERRLF